MKNIEAQETAKNDLAVNPQETPKTEIAKADPLAKITPSERFTNSVLASFSSNNGEIELGRLQKKLIQNYFIKLDGMLKDLETKNNKKSGDYKEALAYNWNNVNMLKMAIEVIAWSTIGLDPTQSNHISLIPYKNKDTNKWDIGFIPGYNGLEIKAKKYGLDCPDYFIIELVYSNDEFKQFKKDMNNRVEGYEFKVVSDFDRGEVMGGFYYRFKDQPKPIENIFIERH
jgi:recombination protein RecT